MKKNFTYSNTNKVYHKQKECTPNQCIDFEGLIDIIIDDPPKELGRVRSIISDSVKSGLDWKIIKDKVKAHKNALPYFLFSGWCPIHHSDKDLQYNSCLQIDIDFKFSGGNRLAKQVKDDLKEIGYILLAAISPSGYGVKCLVQTSNNDKSKHNDSAKQVIKDLSDNLDIDINYFDKLGASQPCFVPYDSDVFYNEDASVFEIDPAKFQKEINPEEIEVNYTDEEIQQAAKFLAEKGILHDSHYDDYIQVIGACCHAFKDNYDFAYNIAYNIFCDSYKFVQNTFDYHFRKVWEHKPINRPATAKTLLYYARNEGFTFNDNRVTVFNGKLGQKASQILKGVDISNKWLVIPTGGGKTYLAANSKGTKIILCPTTALVKNICDTYKAYECRGRKNWKSKIEDARTLSDLPKTMVTTYKSFEILYNLLGDFKKDINLFIDEAHNFSAATNRGFMLNECRFMLDKIPDFKAVTLLTGTYIYNADAFLNSLEVIKVKIPRPIKQAQVIHAENTLKAASMLIAESIQNGRFPILLFDNKSTDGRLGTLKELINDDAVMYFNSDNKQNTYFQNLTTSGLINHKTKGIVTTSVLREGNNINNEYNFDIIILGNYHPSAIEQILNRPRKAKSIKLHIIRKVKDEAPENLPKFFNERSFSKYIEQKAQNTCNELNTDDKLEHEYYERELYARKAIQFLPIRFNNGVYEVDKLELSNYVYQSRKTVENQNIELLKKSLQQYDIEFLEDTANGRDINDIERQAAKERRRLSKEEKEEEYTKEVEELKKQHKDYIEEYCLDHRGKKRSSAIKKEVCNRYLKLSEYFGKDNAIGHMEEIGTSKANFRRLVHQLNISVLESNKKYMDSNREFTMLIKNIRYAFRDGDILSSDKIKEILLQCLRQSVSRTFDIAKMESEEKNNKALNRLRLFFNLEQLRERTLDGLVWKYRVCSIKLGNNVIEKNSKSMEQTEFGKIEQAILKQEFGLKINEHGYPAEWDT